MAETWDESKPAGSRSPTLGDDDVREFKRSMRERLAEDHEFESTESPAFGATNYKIGKHNFITLVQRNTSKVTASDEVAFVCKAVSENPEVLLTPPSAGTDRQLTKNSGANLNLNSGDFASGIIPAGSLSAATVNSSNIVDGAVVSAKIAADQVNSSHIANSSISLAMMLANAIDSDQYVDGSIDFKHLSAGMFQIFGDFNEYSDTTGSWNTVWSSYFICPNDPTSLKAICRCKYVGFAGKVRFGVNGVYGTDTSVNQTSYTQEPVGAVDISGLTPGTVYEINIQLKSSGGDEAYMQGFMIYKDA
jgi:hypothetical protein